MKNWDDIKIFLALAEHRTIRGAANALGMTHVTVTRRIRALEEEIGTLLFERRPSGHELTAAGRSIFQMARSVKENVMEVDRTVNGIDKKLAGTVRLSLPEAIATVLVAPELPEFRALYPQISLELKLSDNLVNLAENQTDIALRLTSEPPEAAYGRRIANSPLCIYCSAAYLQARPAEDVWVGLDYEPARKMSGQDGVAIQANGMLALTELLASGLGVGVLPCFLGDFHPRLQRLDRAVPKPDLDLWLLVHKDLRAVPRVRAVADFLFERLLPKRSAIEGGQ